MPQRSDCYGVMLNPDAFESFRRTFGCTETLLFGNDQVMFMFPVRIPAVLTHRVLWSGNKRWQEEPE